MGDFNVIDGLQFINLPIEVAKRSDLSMTAKVVFGFLNAFHQSSIPAYPSLTTICKACGTSQPSVSKAVRDLEDAGLISRVSRKTKKGGLASNLYVNEWLKAKAARMDDPLHKNLMGDTKESYRNKSSYKSSTKPEPTPEKQDSKPTPPQGPDSPPGASDRLPTPQDFYYLADAALRPPQAEYNEPELVATALGLAEAAGFGAANTKGEYERAVKLLHRHPAIALAPAEVLGVFEQWAKDRAIRRLKTLVTGATRDAGLPYWKLYLGYHQDAQGKGSTNGKTKRRPARRDANKAARAGIDKWLAEQTDADPKQGGPGRVP